MTTQVVFDDKKMVAREEVERGGVGDGPMADNKEDEIMRSIPSRRICVQRTQLVCTYGIVRESTRLVSHILACRDYSRPRLGRSYCTTSVVASPLLCCQLHATVLEVLLLTAIQWDPKLVRVSAVHNKLGPHTALYRTKVGYMYQGIYIDYNHQEHSSGTSPTKIREEL